MGEHYYCDECGEPFVIDPDSGVANHLKDDGTVDYDADHVAYGEEPCGDEDDDQGEDLQVFGDETSQS